MKKTLASKAKLNAGVEIPWLGLGVWQSARGSETYDAVRAALDAGYRHVDTAKIYGNERDVGRAIADSGVPRAEVFVTTKLWNADHGYDAAIRACQRSLEALGTSYVDLYLIHWPQPERHESWRALNALQREGKCHAIGVSNFTIAHLRQLMDTSPVAPAVNQVEMHPFLYQKELEAFCRAHHIQLEAYSPLAHGKRLDQPVLGRVAKKHGKSPAQVLIRWCLEHDFLVIPKSVRKDRIVENADVFDFELDGDDMGVLDGLNEDLRTCWDPTDVR